MTLNITFDNDGSKVIAGFYVNEVGNADFSLAVMGSINIYANKIGNADF